jgi:hypothetical protein
MISFSFVSLLQEDGAPSQPTRAGSDEWVQYEVSRYSAPTAKAISLVTLPLWSLGPRVRALLRELGHW